jgi:hypothetical protein
LAPAHWIATGYRYDFAQGLQARGDDRLRLTLPASDKPRLVSWAVAGAAATLAVTGGDGADESHPVAVGSFTSYEYVAAGAPASMELSRSGSGPDDALAFAVYEQGATVSPAVERDGVGFRRTMAGDQLLAAQVGEPGQTELTLRFPAPAGRVRFVAMCSATASGSWMETAINGETMTSGSCGGIEPGDAGSGGFTPARPLGEEGQTQTLTTQLRATKESAQLLVDPAARVAVAAYAVAESATKLGGMDVARLVEQDGHTWRLVGTSCPSPCAGRTPSAGSDRVRMDLPASAGPWLLVAVVGGRTSAATLTVAGRRQELAPNGTGGTWMSSGQVAWPTRDRSVVLDAGSPAGWVGLAWYRLAAGFDGPIP